MKEKSEYKESAPWAYVHLFMSTILKKKIEMTMNEMQHNRLKTMVKEIREKIKTL